VVQGEGERVVAMNQRIRIVLADDHAVVRKGVREVLEEEADMLVVGEASDGQTAVDLALTVQPDVVLMDIHMPRVSGIEATRQICTSAPQVQVVGLSAECDAPFVSALLEAGASGYVAKTAPDYAIARAVRTVVAGGTALEPALQQAVNAYLPQLRQRPAFSLSERETDVLVLVARGLTNKQISARLGISDRTVQGYLQTAYAKLGVRTRTEAVTAAWQRGLLDLSADRA